RSANETPNHPATARVTSCPWEVNWTPDHFSVKASAKAIAAPSAPPNHFKFNLPSAPETQDVGPLPMVLLPGAIESLSPGAFTPAHAAILVACARASKQRGVSRLLVARIIAAADGHSSGSVDGLMR